MRGLKEAEAFATWWAEKYCAPHHPPVNSVEAGYAFEGWKAANRAAPPAPVSRAELTDEQIREIAIRYATFVSPGIYDITKYDCEEDFFNCVRQIRHRSAPLTNEGGSEPAAYRVTWANGTRRLLEHTLDSAKARLIQHQAFSPDAADAVIEPLYARQQPAAINEGSKGDWLPTAENVNALPEGIRQYVHNLETRCDPSGEVVTNALLRDHIRMIEADNKRLREGGKGEGVASRDALIAANPYPSYTYVAQNAAVEQERAEKYARMLLHVAAPQPSAKALTDEQILDCVNAIDYSQMVTADDYIYLIARAVIAEDRALLALHPGEDKRDD